VSGCPLQLTRRRPVEKHPKKVPKILDEGAYIDPRLSQSHVQAKHSSTKPHLPTLSPYHNSTTHIPSYKSTPTHLAITTFQDPYFTRISFFSKFRIRDLLQSPFHSHLSLPWRAPPPDDHHQRQVESADSPRITTVMPQNLREEQLFERGSKRDPSHLSQRTKAGTCILINEQPHSQVLTR
jgi:hypothetical protein